VSAERVWTGAAVSRTAEARRQELFRKAGYAAAHGESTEAAALQLENDPLPPACWLELGPVLREGLEEGMRGHAWHSAAAWTAATRALLAFLNDLESRRGACGLARAIATGMERSIPAEVVPRGGLATGFVEAIRLEATCTVEDVAVAEGVEILRAIVTVEGCALGEVELPVCDGVVAREVLADAIAASFAWPLLGRFFACSIYPELHFRVEGSGFACRRNDLRLASGLIPENGGFGDVHDRVGWTIFLQELWGLPDWSADRFYAGGLDIPAGATAGTLKQIRLEIAGLLPNIDTRGREIEITVTLGGAGVTMFLLPAGLRTVTAQELRAAIIRMCGMELARVAVREAIVGRPLSGPPLRARLAAAAADRGEAPVAGRNGWAIGQRPRSPIGTTASRWAGFPCETSPAVLADAAGEKMPVTRLGDPHAPGQRVLYVPGWIGRRAAPRTTAGAAPRASRVVTRELPVLMYHRVTPERGSSPARYTIAPREFEAQIRHLHDAGYHSVPLDHWRVALDTRRPLPGRAIILTFDDGYRDFREHAWPILEKYGFSAVIAIVADLAGGVNEWDSPYETVPLMGWDEIRSLQREGVEIASHSSRHRPLIGLDPAQVARDLLGSQETFRRELGRPADCLVYPYGFANPAVHHLAGACGFIFGLTAKVLPCRFHYPLMDLPRIEVSGEDSLESFRAKLGFEAA